MATTELRLEADNSVIVEAQYQINPMARAVVASNRFVPEFRPQIRPQRPVDLAPSNIFVGKNAGKSMVGVTGFEPATPTSRTYWQTIPIISP